MSRRISKKGPKHGDIYVEDLISGDGFMDEAINIVQQIDPLVVLSSIAWLWDPLGLFGRVITKSKIFFQKLYHEK